MRETVSSQCYYLLLSGFSMFLHDNGCICPKPESQTGLGEASVTVKGGPVFYSQSGGSVELQCVVTGLVSPPLSLVWKQGQHVISARTWEGISLETVRQWPVSLSSLVISNLQLSHTGNYSCVSDNVDQTVLLVVSSDTQQPFRPEQKNSGNLSTQPAPASLIILIFMSSFGFKHRNNP